MLQSTLMLSRQDNANLRVCQRDSSSPMWTHTEMVDSSPIIAAVARAYNATHPASDVGPDAIVRPGRTPHVAQARHLCAYLLVEDYHLTNIAAAQALGRTNHTTVVNSRARVVAALARLLKGAHMVRLSQVYAASLARSIQRSMASST